MHPTLLVEVGVSGHTEDGATKGNVDVPLWDPRLGGYDDGKETRRR